MAVTGTPADCRRATTAFHDELSANAPCTRATVGPEGAAMLASDMRNSFDGAAGRCLGRAGGRPAGTGRAGERAGRVVGGRERGRRPPGTGGAPASPAVVGGRAVGGRR